MRNKIFNLGLPKTGQTSLASAMRILGYKVVEYPYTTQQIKEHDVALDIPVLINYKKLDKKYPNSKFIFTTRDYDSWIKSLRNHYRNNPAHKRHVKQLMYRLEFWQTVNFNKRLMTKKYYSHIEDVKNYFRGREKDLLIINICNGEEWKKLCKFLNKPIPKDRFPKKNIGIYKIRH